MLSYQLLEYSKFVVETFSSLPPNLQAMIDYAETCRGLINRLGNDIFIDQRRAVARDATSGKSTVTYLIDLPKDIQPVIDSKTKALVADFDLLRASLEFQKLETSLVEFSSDSEPFFQIVKKLEMSLTFLQDYIKNKSRETLMLFFLNTDTVNSVLRKELDFCQRVIATLATSEYPEQASVGKVLEIQLLGVTMDVRQFGEMILCVNAIYDEIKMATDFKESLEIVKIESGSLLLTILGNPAIITAIGSIVIIGIKLMHKKFSTEGKLATQNEFLKALSKEAEIIEKLKNLNIEVEQEATESFSKSFSQISKNICRLTKSSPKIKVNDELFSIPKEKQIMFLEARDVARLVSGEDTVAEDSGDVELVKK